MISAAYKQSVYNILVPLAQGEETLIFNTLSRAFSVLTSSELQFVSGMSASNDFSEPSTAALLDRLILNGYVVPADVDELARVETYYNIARHDQTSLMLTIAPTLFCNFGCDYCFQGKDKPVGKMSPEVMQATVAYLERHLDKIKSFHVAWYGGEPLMGLDVIEQLSRTFIAACDARHVSYAASIITNGYLLTRPVATRLRDCRVSIIQITLDGAAGDHDKRRHLLSERGTYARIVENIASWVDDHPISVNLRVNIDARNQDGVKGLIDDLAARGLGGKTVTMYFAPVEATTTGCAQISDLTMGKTEYASLETDLLVYAYEKKLSIFPFPPRFMGLCGAMRPKAFVITPTGDLHKCWDTVSFAHQKVGNIRDVDATAGNALNDMWNQWSPFDNDSCRNCKILPTCSGSCAYKFVHATETRGEAAVLPCPSWKFSFKEKLLQLARLKGHIGPEQIPHGQVTNPQELCCFEWPQQAAGLPEKILAAKEASYAAAAMRVGR